MFTEFVAASQSIKVLGDLIRSASELKNFNEVAAALSKVQEALLAAQAAALQSQERQSELLTEVAELKEKLSAVASWESVREKYQLLKTSGGAVVYRFSGDPEHYVCPSCFEKHQVQILQDARSLSGNFVCPGCKVNYPVTSQKPIHVAPSSNNW